MLRFIGFRDQAADRIMEDWPAELRRPPIHPRMIYNAGLMDRACSYIRKKAPHRLDQLGQRQSVQRDRALKKMGINESLREEILGEEWKVLRVYKGLEW